MTDWLVSSGDRERRSGLRKPHDTPKEHEQRKHGGVNLLVLLCDRPPTPLSPDKEAKRWRKTIRSLKVG